MRIALLTALSVLAIGQAGRAADPAPVKLTADEQAAVIKALNRGSLIYAYDQAAWHGTDDMLARLKANGTVDTVDTVVNTIAGWVVEGPVSAPVLTFFDNDAQQPHVLYTATMTGYGRTVATASLIAASEKRAVTPAQLNMIAALKRARAALATSEAKMCSEKRSNTVVLPPEAPGEPTLVYFLTPQTTNDSYPMGGHYRVDVGNDGATPVIRPFAKSCLGIGWNNKTEKKPEALVVTHLLDPVPTEIHVFTVFAAGLPIYVATSPGARLWAVEVSNGHARTRLLESNSAKK